MLEIPPFIARNKFTFERRVVVVVDNEKKTLWLPIFIPVCCVWRRWETNLTYTSSRDETVPLCERARANQWSVILFYLLYYSASASATTSTESLRAQGPFRASLSFYIYSAHCLSLSAQLNCHCLALLHAQCIIIIRTTTTTIIPPFSSPSIPQKEEEDSDAIVFSDGDTVTLTELFFFFFFFFLFLFSAGLVFSFLLSLLLLYYQRLLLLAFFFSFFPKHFVQLFFFLDEKPIKGPHGIAQRQQHQMISK